MVKQKEYVLWRERWILILALPLNSCETWSKLPTHHEPFCESPLQNGTNTHFIVLWGLNEITYAEQNEYIPIPLQATPRPPPPGAGSGTKRCRTTARIWFAYITQLYKPLWITININNSIEANRFSKRWECRG